MSSGVRNLIRRLAMCVATITWCTGAYAADWSFAPSVTLREYYDSNINFTTTDVEDDFVTRLSPVFSLTRETEDSKLNFDSEFDTQNYLMHPVNNVVLYNERLNLAQGWNDWLSTNLNGVFIKDTTLETQLEQAGLRSLKANRYLYNLGLTENYAVSERLSIATSESGSIADYPDQNEPNQQGWQVGAGPVYQLSPKDTVGLNVSCANTNYEKTPTSFASTIGSLQETVTWQRSLNETTSFNLGVGNRTTLQEATELTEKFYLVPGTGVVGELVPQKVNSTDDGPTFSASINKAWSDRLSSTLSTGVEQYNSVNAQANDHKYVTGGVTYALSEVTNLHCGLSFDNNAVIGQTNQTVMGQTSQTSNYVSISPVIERRLSERLTVRAGGQYMESISNGGGTNSTAERYLTYLELSYAWPRFFATH